MDSATRRQMRVEAARGQDRPVDRPPDHLPIPPDERVEPQPGELYRPPDWLAKTATPGQVADLAALFDELRGVNDEFVGELVHEVAVYFTATGLHLDLTDRFRAWCDGYVRRRADPANMNPGVGPHPFYLHQKVLKEVYQLLSPLFNRDGTLHIGVLGEPLRYADWLGYDLLWKGDIRAEAYGDLSVPGDLPGGEAMGQWLINYAADRNYLDDQMPTFLDRVGAWAAGRGGPATPGGGRLLPDLAALADDIQAMRPLLVRNFRPEKTRLRVAENLWVAWNWQVANGIAHVVAARTEAGLLTALATNWGSPGMPLSYAETFCASSFCRRIARE